jgi:hypothetical protein
MENNMVMLPRPQLDWRDYYSDSSFGPTKKEKLELIGNIRNQAIYEYTLVADICGIIQNYIFGNGKDKKSKKLFKELEDLILAEPDRPDEYIQWLYREKLDEYLEYVPYYTRYRPSGRVDCLSTVQYHMSLSGHINVYRPKPCATREEELILVHSIRNREVTRYGLGTDDNSKELFKELEELILAEPDGPDEYILWLHEKKVSDYIVYIYYHPPQQPQRFPVMVLPNNLLYVNM